MKSEITFEVEVCFDFLSIASGDFYFSVTVSLSGRPGSRENESEKCF
jgi:hypothetical protein